MLRAVIVDDEPDMLLLMRAMLTFDGECEVVAEAADATRGFDAWETTRPDVIVLDMRMPGENGLDVARRILAVDPGQRVIMCSAYMDDREIAEAHDVGVAACLEKTDVGRLAQLVWAVSGAA